MRQMAPLLVFTIMLGLGLGLGQGAGAAAAEERYDVVVYGGTSAGVTAAVQAARMDRSVLLIEPSEHLGGLSSSGLSKTDIGNRDSVGGLAREFYDRVGDVYGTGLEIRFEPHVAERVFDELVEEAGVTVVRGERLDRPDGVRMQGRRIEAITMESGRTFHGDVFLDTTYVGDLMAAAGVSFTVGREPADQYDEPLAGMLDSGKYVTTDIDPYVERGDPSSGLIAGVQRATPIEPGEGDDLVQAYNYRLCLTQRDANKVAITKPEGYGPADYELLVRYFEKQPDLELDDVLLIGGLRGGKADINNWGYSALSTDYIGGNYNYPEGSYAERRRIERAHKRHIQGLLWFLGHDERVPERVRRSMRRWGYAADEFVDNGHWPYELYVREARRMVGSYVMVQANCEGRRTAEMPIALGSYNMDSHTVQRYVNEDGHMRKDGFFIKGSAVYPIDYRAITPKAGECENLLVPVCLSASHVAFGSIRMEPVFMMLGQSAGTAAVQAIEQDAAVQEVDYAELRRRLIADGQKLEPVEARRPSLRSEALAGVVLDDSQAELVGEWATGSVTTPFVDEVYRHDGNAGKGQRAVHYRFEVPEAGRYEIRMSYPPHGNRASQVPVTIAHADGEKTVRVDQRRAPEGDSPLALLGTFEFGEGERVTVTIANKGTDGYVIADAVQLKPAE